LSDGLGIAVRILACRTIRSDPKQMERDASTTRSSNRRNQRFRLSARSL
jgi:hypothetical protein